jgi:hypothetical protein
MPNQKNLSPRGLAARGVAAQPRRPEFPFGTGPMTHTAGEQPKSNRAGHAGLPQGLLLKAALARRRWGYAEQSACNDRPMELTPA